MIDFRSMARDRLGDDAWSGLNESARRSAMREEKRLWMATQLGGPSGGPSYAEWLRDQPQKVQDAALGVTRAKLWRDGKLTIERFLDPSGRPLTLKQLAATRPEAFNRAGLDPAAFQGDPDR